MAVFGSIHKYMGEQINVIGPNVSQEMVAELRKSSGQFGNEMGSRASSLKGVQ